MPRGTDIDLDREKLAEEAKLRHIRFHQTFSEIKERHEAEIKAYLDPEGAKQAAAKAREEEIKREKKKRDDESNKLQEELHAVWRECENLRSEKQ